MFKKTLWVLGLLLATVGAQAQMNFSKAGAPTGTCVSGSIYARNDGTATSTLYLCVSGAWVGAGTTVWPVARLLAGNSVDGSANVPFANKFIVQGTADSGLSGAQFTGALATGILKNTTTTGVLSIAVAGDFPTLNQNTTGTASNLSGTPALPNGTTATTQAVRDNSTKLATTAYADSRYVGATLAKSETGADVNVLTYTPPAATGMYQVNIVISVSAANTATVGWTATWKDVNGNGQSPGSMPLYTVSGGTAPPAYNPTATAGITYNGSFILDTDSSATAIVVKTAFSGISIAYKVSATIEKLQ